VLGAIGYGIVFWIICLVVDPQISQYAGGRGLFFGLTFGQFGGAIVGASMSERADNKQPSRTAWLIGALSFCFAGFMLFSAGGWSAIFAGGLGEWLIIFLWALSIGGLIKVLGK
jgi:hypothetical protein